MSSIIAEPLRVVVVSYFPMSPLSGSMEELKAVMDSLPDGCADACAWAEVKGEVSPVLLMNNARALAEHMKEWSEGKPTEWFSLVIEETDGKYAVALVPRIDKSVERNRIAYHLKNGWPLPENTKFEVAFGTVRFVSESKKAFDPVKERLGKTVEIYLTETGTFDPRGDMDLISLGRFELNVTEMAVEFVMSMLEPG
jgi:hypothetical protein